MLSLRRKRVHGAETDLQAVNGGNGMCNYPVSNIQYPLFNDGGANWILAVGYLHISTFYKKGATHEALCTNQLVLRRSA